MGFANHILEQGWCTGDHWQLMLKPESHIFLEDVKGALIAKLLCIGVFVTDVCVLQQPQWMKQSAGCQGMDDMLMNQPRFACALLGSASPIGTSHGSRKSSG